MDQRQPSSDTVLTLPRYSSKKGNVETGRQRRSRPFVVLTYSPVRSARQSACGLAKRTPRLREGMLFEHPLFLLTIP